jgi:hypothetical protein
MTIDDIARERGRRDRGGKVDRIAQVTVFQVNACVEHRNANTAPNGCGLV